MKPQTPTKTAFSVSRWLSVLTLALCSLSPVRAGGEGWLTNFEGAKKQAADGGKDLLLDFTGSDWCPPCMALNKEVFSQKAFLEASKDRFVLLELDFPQNKEQDGKTIEQNNALQEEYQIQGYPTIILCDASGKPYAKTGYQTGGAEKYADHLGELQAIRVKRDAAFARAEAAKENTDKAAALVEGLGLIAEDLIDAHYGDVIERISQLDPDDKTGFAKIRKEAMARKEAEARAEAALEQFAEGKLMPLIEAKEFDKAVTATKAFIKGNPDISAESGESLLLGVGLAGPLDAGDLEAAQAVIDQIAREYPDGEIARNIDEVKADVAEDIKAMKENGEQDPE